MFQLDILIDISILPSNIMTLRDDDFIDFVKEEAGHSAATLLEIQGINCVKSLLMANSVYAIMDVKSKSLDGLKIKYGYMQDDGTVVIQPGVKGNIEHLTDLLKTKFEGEHYFILLQNDSNGALKCDIRCYCQKWSSLSLRRGKFQLSNFYRHLQGLNNICPALKKMISNPQSALPSPTNNPPPLITSHNVPQQVASPNQIPFNQIHLYPQHLLLQYQQIMMKALCNNHHQ
ncbi:unnamed protein product [Rotaria socialis]|uniref:Uncharacterized protein n=1 Tax=Rotaria socialis TaxID=392032 RepID=A0A820QHQ4_9BILA|nr:unnamed protein product [Rotaria socialis]CAF3489760.1 unnamed protein product [Rotaria socialis]CAF4295884.1 unnamed protein product [Rotaria socialis]CAF4419144.1 unnamed protein product [Rotaria socialis]CAF4489490.1 unnamed protein product [Rotaria socialis]